MKVTNNEGLPSGFYNACLREYEKEEGVYSATEVLKGVTEILLERRHGEEVETDCADMVWMIFGSAVHKVMEDHTVGDTQIAELSLKADCFGSKLKGHLDLYDAESGAVIDYKTCSVWKVIFGDYTDWKRQGQIYCWLLRENGLEGKSFEVVALMKDHSKRDASLKPEYPKRPVKRIPFEISDKELDEIEKFLALKMELLEMYSKEPDENLPPCEPEERWAKPDTYAVMKTGRKTALRVLESHSEAVEWMEANSGDFIEERKGIDKKCTEYCSVCEFCPYWKENYGTV